MTIPSNVARQTEDINKFYSEEGKQEETQTNNQNSESYSEKNNSSDSGQTEDYEKRFKSYKASTDKTIFELRNELRENQNTLKQYQESLDLYKEKLEDADSNRAKFTETDLENFSEDELEVVDRIVNQKNSTLLNELNTLKSELEFLKDKELQKEHQQSSADLKNQIRETVGSDFDFLDTHPQFAEWISDVDDFGSIRKDLLSKAIASKDLYRVVSFYTEFRKLLGDNSQQSTDHRRFNQVPDSSSNAAQIGEQVRVWTSADIQNFYKDVGLGRYTDAEQKKIEAEIQLSLTGG